MFNSKASCTTTGLTVGDNEQHREPIQTDADRNAADSGTKLPAPKYAGNPGSTTLGLSAEQPSELSRVTIKPVDRKTLAGSTPGDFRNQPGDVAKASVARAADNGGPRNDVGQFKSSKYESQPATQKYPGDCADSDGGN